MRERFVTGLLYFILRLGSVTQNEACDIDTSLIMPLPQFSKRFLASFARKRDQLPIAPSTYHFIETDHLPLLPNSECAGAYAFLSPGVWWIVSHLKPTA